MKDKFWRKWHLWPKNVITQIFQSSYNFISTLGSTHPEAFLNKAVDCHLRMSSVVQKDKDKCELCTVHDNIEIYEGMLFYFVKGEISALEGKNVRSSLTEAENKKLEDAGVVLMDELRRGAWKDSESERLLRAVLKFSKNSLSTFKVQKTDWKSGCLRFLEWFEVVLGQF